MSTDLGLRVWRARRMWFGPSGLTSELLRKETEMTLKNTLFAAACALLVAGVGHALAQQPTDKPAATPPATKPAAGRDRVCAADAAKFCKDVRPGGGRMYQCLSKNDAELAPACRERLAAGKARWDKFTQECKGDLDKYCKAVPTGSGRVLSCLKGREADLAPGCRAEFAGARRNTVVTQ